MSAVIDFVSDVVSDVVEGVGDVVEGVVDTVGDVVQTALDNPIATIGLIGAGIATGGFGLLGAEALGGGLGVAEGATGLATLGESVLPAAEAFGAGAGTVATDAALAAGASGLGAGAEAVGAGLGGFGSEAAIDPFADTVTVADTTAPEVTTPTLTGTETPFANTAITGDASLDTAISDGTLAGTGGSASDIAVDAANAAGADMSGTDAASQYMTGSGDVPPNAYGDANTSLKDAYDTAKQIKKVSDLFSGTPAKTAGSVLGGGLLNSSGTTASNTASDTSDLNDSNFSTKVTPNDWDLFGFMKNNKTDQIAIPGITTSLPMNYNTSQTTSQQDLLDPFSPTVTHNSERDAYTSPLQQATGGYIGYSNGGFIPQFHSEGGASYVGTRDGDGTEDKVPALLSSNEYVLSADVVSALGNGSPDKGASVLDNFVKAIRAHKQKNGDELPPDSLGPLTYLQKAMKGS